MSPVNHTHASTGHSGSGARAEPAQCTWVPLPAGRAPQTARLGAFNLGPLRPKHRFPTMETPPLGPEPAPPARSLSPRALRRALRGEAAPPPPAPAGPAGPPPASPRRYLRSRPGSHARRERRAKRRRGRGRPEWAAGGAGARPLQRHEGTGQDGAGGTGSARRGGVPGPSAPSAVPAAAAGRGAARPEPRPPRVTLPFPQHRPPRAGGGPRPG